MPETYYPKKRRGIAGLTGRASTRVPPKEYWPGLGESELGFSKNITTGRKDKSNPFSSSTKFQSVTPKSIGKNNVGIGQKGNRMNKNMARSNNQLPAGSSRNSNTQRGSKFETSGNPKSTPKPLVNLHMRRRSPKRRLKLSPKHTPVVLASNNKDKGEGTVSDTDRVRSDQRNEQQQMKREAQHQRKQPEQQQSQQSQQSSEPIQQQQSSEPIQQQQQQSQQSPPQSPKPRKTKNVKRMFTELFPHNTVGLKPAPFEIEETRKPRLTQSPKRQSAPLEDESRREKRRRRMLAELAPHNAVGLVSDETELKTEETPQKPKTKQQPQPPDSERTQDKPCPPRVNRMLASIAPFNSVGQKEVETGKRRSRRSESRSEPQTSRARGNRPKRKRANQGSSFQHENQTEEGYEEAYEKS